MLRGERYAVRSAQTNIDGLDRAFELPPATDVLIGAFAGVSVPEGAGGSKEVVAAGPVRLFIEEDNDHQEIRHADI